MPNLCEHQTKAVFGLKLTAGWGEHKVVLDESGCRACCVRGGWGLEFLFILWLFYLRFWISLPSCTNIQRSPFLVFAHGSSLS